MKFTHRSVGPRKAVGNAFIPGHIEPRKAPQGPPVHLLFNQAQPLKAHLGKDAGAALKEWLRRA